jgi:hypothetical protein
MDTDIPDEAKEELLKEEGIQIRKLIAELQPEIDKIAEQQDRLALVALAIDNEIDRMLTAKAAELDAE